MDPINQRDPITRSAEVISTIQQQPAGHRRMKNLDTHQCITIKWSPHSACRVGLTAARAAFGAAPAGTAGVLRGAVLDAVQPLAAGALAARRAGGQQTGGGRS